MLAFFPFFMPSLYILIISFFLVINKNVLCASSLEPELITRQYTWTYKGTEFTYTKKFNKSLYTYYKNRKRVPGNHYEVYATDPFDDKIITNLVEVFKEKAEEHNYSKNETIYFIVTFIQSLPYTVDRVTKASDEYPRFPVETLVDNGGDCEDTSILTAAILKEMGYGVALLKLPLHMAVGIYCTEKSGAFVKDKHGYTFCYLETTGENWKIGKVPDQYDITRAEVIHLKAIPVLSFKWSAEPDTLNANTLTYKVEVIIQNDGSAEAENMRIWMGFETRADTTKVYSQHTTVAIPLKQDNEISLPFTITVDRDIETRIHIMLAAKGIKPRESFSDWYEIE
jgi:hypothetical protein